MKHLIIPTIALVAGLITGLALIVILKAIGV